MTQIIVNHGDKKVLMKTFRCSHVTVRESLRGKKDSDLAKKIRKAAIERGGVEMIAKI